MLRIYVTPPPTITSEDGDISSPPSDGTTPGMPPPRAAAPPGQFFQELLDPRLFGQFAPPPPAPPGKFFQQLLDPRRFGRLAPPQPAPPGQFLASIGVNLPPAVPPVPAPPTLAVRPVPAQDVALDNALLDSAPATGPALPGQDIAGFGTTPARPPAEFERTRGDGIWRNAAAGFSGHVYDRVGQSADPAAEVINYGIDGLNRVAGTDVGRLPAPSRWLAENAETYLGVPDPQHTLAVTAGEKAARLGGKAAAFLAELRLLRGRSLPGYGLPGPGLPVPGDRSGPPAPGGPGHPERWDASYEDARDLGQFGLDLFGELRDAIYPPAPPPLKSLDQASDDLEGGVVGPGDGMPQVMVQGGRAIRDRSAPLTGGAMDQPARRAESGGERKPTGEFYSVAFEMKLAPTSYPGVSRESHNQEANEALLSAMEQNPEFAEIMRTLGVELQRMPRGKAPRRPPPGWTWHHADEPGLMQLVPRSQHQAGMFRRVFHPDGGKGGYDKWGK